MGRYLLVENEDKTLQTFKDTLISLDSDARLEIFNDFNSLKTHFDQLEESEKQTFWNFDLSILAHGLLPHPEWNEKIKSLREQNSKSSALLLTGYENSFTTTKYLRTLNIDNFLFKPLDPLILKESLNISLNLNKKVTPLEMKAHSISAFVAFLKEVELQSISELGFVTTSDTQIPQGSTTKYFSSIFEHGKKRSIWAECLLSHPHPQQPGLFINKFQFIAADQVFLNNLRRHIRDNKSHQTSAALWSFVAPKNSLTLKIAVVGKDTIENKLLMEDLKHRFTNVQVDLIDVDPNPQIVQPVHEHEIVINSGGLTFASLTERFKPEAEFLLVRPAYSDEDEIKEDIVNYLDISCLPFDKSYFFKKLKIHFPDLNEKETSSIINISSHVKIKVANKVKVTDPCELFVNIIYPRELPANDFREIVFLSEDEGQMIELPAVCHFAEKAKGTDVKEGFFHQFVFFGMKDLLLKQIRLWLLQTYILQNQKEE